MTKLNDTKEIGRTLRYRRKTLHLSQQAIAKEHGMVYATIRAAEQGKDVSMRTLLSMCESLKMKILLVPSEDI